MNNILTFITRFITIVINIFKGKDNDQKNCLENGQVCPSHKDFINKYGGRLLLKNEIQINAKQLQDAIDKNLIIKIKSIEKNILKYTCNRCFNKKQSLFAMMPCLQCNEQVIYCRNCIQMGRVRACESLYAVTGHSLLWQKHSSPCTWTGTLTPHQLKASHKLLHNMKGNKNTLVWSVTGSGKTEMIFPTITEALQAGKRICIATPRKDVVLELFPRLQKAFQNVPIQALYGGSKGKERQAQLVITTTHQLIRFKRTFDVLIVDEIDAFPYHKDHSLPLITENARKKIGMTIYLTATPRNKQKWKMKLNQLDYVFVPARFHGHPLPIPKLRYSITLKSALKQKNLPKEFEKWLENRENPQRQLLIFVPTINLTTDLIPHLSKFIQNQNTIINNGVSSVHAEDVDREEKINLFRKKKIMILLTTTILERGVTFPSVDVVVLNACHSIFDEQALIQIAGRAGRSAEDPTGEVIYFYEQKTDALIKAKQTIEDMNERAKKLK